MKKRCLKCSSSRSDNKFNFTKFSQDFSNHERRKITAKKVYLKQLWNTQQKGHKSDL